MTRGWWERSALKPAPYARPYPPKPQRQSREPLGNSCHPSPQQPACSPSLQLQQPFELQQRARAQPSPPPLSLHAPWLPARAPSQPSPARPSPSQLSPWPPSPSPLSAQPAALSPRPSPWQDAPSLQHEQRLSLGRDAHALQHARRQQPSSQPCARPSPVQQCRAPRSRQQEARYPEVHR